MSFFYLSHLILQSVKSIVQAHHGTITVFNNVLNGCTFEFLIPMDYENGALSSVEG